MNLLAKSTESPTIHETVYGHNMDVGDTCKMISLKLRSLIISIFGATSEIESLFKVYPLSGYCHDIGKANSHFQKMLMKTRFSQVLRHEVFSVVFLLDGNITKILETNIEKFMMIYSILNHHLKFSAMTQPYGLRDPGNEETPDEIYFNDQQVKSIWEKVCGEIGNPLSGNFKFAKWNKSDAGKKLLEIKKICADGEKYFSEINSKIALFLSKSLLINADVYASAFFATSKKAYKSQVILSELLDISLSPQEIQNIIDKNLPEGAKLRGFQVDIANSKSNTVLVLASCGSGKSVGAYGRIKTKIISGPQTRGIYLQPTTTTASEHHKQHALNFVEYADLDHSRAIIDIEEFEKQKIAESNNQFLVREKSSLDDISELADQIDVIARMRSPLITGTCDLVLGLITGIRRSIYMLIFILQSIIIFDEIHSYDDTMFGHLLMFLKYFPKVPVTLMSATLQKERIDALKIIRPDLDIIHGDPKFAKMERHNFSVKSNPKNDVIKAVKNGEQIIWIRNRVSWAIETYNELKANLNENVILFHSRFKYPDKLAIQRRAVDNFKKGECGVTIGTQVMEMALDISSHLLVTDFAPPNSLTQRIGRNARYLLAGQPLGSVIFVPIKEENNLPYTKKGMKEGCLWIQKLQDKNVSQEIMGLIADEIVDPCKIDFNLYEENALGLNSLWDTTPGLTRNSSTTFRVVMLEDYQKCEERDFNDEPTNRWFIQNEINMPIWKIDFMHWGTTKGRIIAPKGSMNYDKEFGGSWN